MRNMPDSKFASGPPHVSHTLITFPADHVLLVTLNRPQDLNCVNTTTSHELDSLWKWYDDEPSLRCAVITGSGRAFCTGGDLKEFHRIRDSNQPVSEPPKAGFAGLTSRRGKKPIIAAVNGLAYGGGCEIAVNADMLIASASSKFAIQDAKLGTTACAGVLPRLVSIIGMQRATEMALTGRSIDAWEAKEFGLVNSVVTEDKNVIREALRMAEAVANSSPDSVIDTRKGLRSGWITDEAEETNREICMGWGPHCQHENYKEALAAFKEKRKPRWVDSKL